jgi:hypothetical protein
MNCIKDYFTDRGDDKIGRLDMINAFDILVLLNEERPGWLVINYERLLEEQLQMLRDEGVLQNEEWVIQVVTMAIWERLEAIDSFAGTNFSDVFSHRFIDPEEDYIKVEDIEINW